MFSFPVPIKQSTLLVACAWASLAHAQQATEPGASAEVHVSATGYRTTGTKSSLKPLEAPMSYEVVDADVLAARQADSVNEALRYVAGITPESRPTVTIFDQYTIRGFESYRNYYDGLPLQYNGLWNLVPQVDAFATHGVEVLKGPTSVLYGAAPPGGMVNQIAKMPQAQPERLLRARVGSNRLRELALDSTGPLSENADYRLIALTRSKDGQQATTREERHMVAPSLTWRVNGDTRINFNLYHQDDPSMIPSTPLPATGTLRTAPYGLLGANAYAGDENWAGFERKVTMGGWKFEHQLNQFATFLQNFRYTDARGFQRNTYNHGLRADGRTLDRSAYFTDESQHGYVADHQLALRIHTGAVSHRLLAGAEFQKLGSSVHYGDTLGNSTAPIDLASPDYRQLDPASLPLDFYSERHRIRQSQLGLYLQDELRWDALTVIAGLRRDRYRSADAGDSVYSGSAWSTETRIAQLDTSGRLAAIYTLPSGLAPYVNYSESFEPTAGVDSVSGTAFKPTTAKQIEAGVKFKSADGTTVLSAAAFDIRKQNVVVNTPDFMRHTQTGEVQSRGAELSLNQQVGASADLTLALTRLDASVTKNPLDPALVGKRPVWVAESQASAWINYFATPDLELSGGLRYVGKSQMDATNTATVPAYTLIDLAANYRMSDKLRLGFTVGNLADKRYVGACYNANNCWMGAQRSVELTLNATF